MRRTYCLGLPALFIALGTFYGSAQSQEIATGAGSLAPANGATAVSQSIGTTASVAADGAGGFYFVSSSQGQVYRVSANDTISLIAGNPSGFRGYSGDGGPAASAQLNYPTGIAKDNAGNLYISDFSNQRVRKITANGIISTVAGNGSSGYSGDGGPAISARLSLPYGVAVDTGGNLYIADSGNNRIRKVTTDGMIRTVAGTGSPGYSGDGGPAASAQLRYPFGVAVDGAGNFYIADSGNNRVRRVNADGIIGTVAGNGDTGSSGDGGPAASAQLFDPSGVNVDAAGSLYIADNYNNRIRKVTTDGVIRTVAGNGTLGYGGDGGPAASAELNYPTGIATDEMGILYVADFSNSRIRKVTADGVIRTVAGNGHSSSGIDGGPAASAQLSDPYGVAADAAGNLYIADSGNNRIRKVTAAGVISTVVGSGTLGYSGDGGPAASAQLNSPFGIAADSAGNLYIADTYNNRIRKVTAAGIVSTLAGNGTSGYGGDGGPAASAQLNNPSGIAVDRMGNIYIADTSNSRIREVTADGVIRTVAGNGGSGFSGDGGPAASAQLGFPTGVAVDRANNIYIADYTNNRIRKVTTEGVIRTVAGNGGHSYSGDEGPATSAQLSDPSGVAVDAAGNIYIADNYNNRIRKVTPDGVIRTVAGNGGYGYSGDGGPAASAQLSDPSGVAVDPAGNIYIVDGFNSIVRKVTAGGVIRTVASNELPGYCGDQNLPPAAQPYVPRGIAMGVSGNLNQECERFPNNSPAIAVKYLHPGVSGSF